MSKLDEFKFGDKIESEKLIPGFGGKLMGKEMKLVGTAFVFLGDSGITSTVKLWAADFDPKEYGE